MTNIIASFEGYERYEDKMYMCYKSQKGHYLLSWNRLEKGDTIEGGIDVEIFGVPHLLLT